MAAQASPFFDWLLFSKIKARLGGRVRIALSGAAPLAPHVEDFLRVGLCCHFFQGASPYLLALRTPASPFESVQTPI